MSVKAALTDTRPTWHNPKVLSLLLLVLLTGFVGGVLATKLYIAPDSVDATTNWNSGGREKTLQMLQKELDLTPDQATKIGNELDDFVLYYQVLKGQIDDWRREGKSRIVRILTPEQQQKFERITQDKRPGR